MQQSTGSRASPIFYQYITDKLFRKLVVSKHPVNNEHQGEETTELSYEEENALRYVAGYVCRAVRSQLKRERASDDHLSSLDELLDNYENASSEEDSDDID